MLRCRPSEISLTHADINEKRCYLARRQAAGMVTAMHSRIAGPRGSVPQIRGGPEHSRNETMIRLGFIPVLRPHSAVHSSASSGSSNCLPDGRIYCNDSDSKSVCNVENAPYPEEHDSLPQPYLNLDLLAGPSQRTSPARKIEPMASFSEDPPRLSPPKHEFGFSGFSHTGAHAPNNIAQDLPKPSINPTTNNASDTPAKIPVSHKSLSGGSRIRSPHHQNSITRSPLYQVQATSPPRQSNRARISSTTEFPILYLQGYFEKGPDAYSFRESWLVPSQSLENPPSRTLRRTQTIASSSEARSNNAQSRNPVQRSYLPDTYGDHVASRPSMGQRPQASSDPSIRGMGYLVSPCVFNRDGNPSEKNSSNEELRSNSHLLRTPSNIQGFLDPTATEFTRGNPQPSTVPKPRNRSQEPSHQSLRDWSAQQLSQHPEQLERTPHNGHPEDTVSRGQSSGFDQPHVSYRKPSSRFSSSSHSQHNATLAQAQHDGPVPSSAPLMTPFSSPAPRGTFLPLSASLRPPPVRKPSHSSPNLAALYQNEYFGLSQPPRSPYGHPNSSRSSPRSFGRIITPYDFPRALDSAIDAARRNLSSPLDLVQQRATSQISYTPSAASYRSATSQIDQDRASVVNQRSHFTTPDHSLRTDVQYRLDSGRCSINSAVLGSTSSTDWDRYPEFSLQGPSRNSAPRPLTPFPTPRSNRGNVVDVRLNTRSSENTGPTTSLLSPPGLNNQDPGNRTQPRDNNELRPPVTLWRSPTTFRHSEDRGNNVESRPRLPTAPLFPSILPDGQRPPELMPRIAHSYAPQHGEPQRSRRRSSHRNIRHTQPSLLAQSQSYPHSHFHSADGRDPENRWASRAQRHEPQPQSSRRSRLPAWQHEQENSGDAEEEAMREEIQARGMRGGSGNELEIMDETPPRVGRFERRILGI
ncbi:hypothetical protein AOQ84DRAFT_357078 [Glonium stellatum]|uniref:Uncharacterized protein n=1 Tax=Glonium stellatum TaxID=574774 RepID=A0A8E2ER48_9PEZI|nr:hypothetical protein AOQ84DRAFT_357078 [Glonium stellatum]